MIKRIVTDVLPSQVTMLTNLAAIDGGTVEPPQDQGDGKVTLVVTFPIDLPGDETVPGESPWMSIARAEIGVKEGPRGASNPRIEDYFTATDLGPRPDSVPWCSAFVNFCMRESGMPRTRSGFARSWLAWGREVDEFEPGCVVILSRGQADRSSGHVGFYVGADGDDNIRLLGGNQHDEVNIASFLRERVLGKRIPVTAEGAGRETVETGRAAAPGSGPIGRALQDQIVQIAARSAIARFPWPDRGVAPVGYIKGMAVVYAQVYAKFNAGDPAATEMARANSGDTDRDALAWYADEFATAGMRNDTAGPDTLRHLFVLLIGLGMRESSGKYCCGRDQMASNTDADTAEAGLFQTSYNAHNASPILPAIFAAYRANPNGFVDIFKEGVTCSAADFENFGGGDGEEFQRLSKACPAFAAEFAAVALRHLKDHWGPIKRKEVEIRPDCDAMLREVQVAVDGVPIA